MIIAYIDEIIDNDIQFITNIERRKKLLLHINFLLDSIFLDDEILEHLFKTSDNFDSLPYF